MVKSARKKPKVVVSARNTKKAASSRTKTAEYVGYLLELHKLQGVLLTGLDREVR
jgi:hypothetical protein